MEKTTDLLSVVSGIPSLYENSGCAATDANTASVGAAIDLRLGEGRFVTQTNLPAVVDLEHFHGDLLALFDHILNCLDPFVVEL